MFLTLTRAGEERLRLHVPLSRVALVSERPGTAMAPNGQIVPIPADCRSFLVTDGGPIFAADSREEVMSQIAALEAGVPFEYVEPSRASKSKGGLHLA